ncbi:MAG: ABC transporter permease [Pseudomonadota bacterium]
MAAVAPVFGVVAILIAIWYAAVPPMNIAWAVDRAPDEVVTLPPDTGFAGAVARAAPGWALVVRNPDLVPGTLNQDRPVLPAPHQVMAELLSTTMGVAPMRERRGEMRGNPRSLVFHAWQTLAPTVLGFVFGTAAGILLAIGIVHNRAMGMSVMPWAIASQMVPILAIAPMVIVVLNAVGISGLLPKSLISAYLSFFPVVVGMVKGLRSPAGPDLDLMHTYSASPSQVLWKLRFPAATPYLFASLKVGIAASLVGAIVAELPTGARFGLGSRLLSGSYYGQTIEIWSALFMAAICAATLVGLVGLTERLFSRRMGAAG